MSIKVGDYVSRNSYQNDTIFKVINIEDGICILKGLEVRLIADSPITDLKTEEIKEMAEDESLEILKDDLSNRNEYFYLPAKVLHIEADFFVTDTLANPYKIRENG